MWFAAAFFIEVHAVDGATIEVAPSSIVSMRGRGHGKTDHFVEGANCMINLADGKFIAVREKCEDVYRLIEQAR